MTGRHALIEPTVHADLGTDGLHVGAYVHREDGPRGDDEGVIQSMRQHTAVVYSYIHGDLIVYLRRDLTREPV